MHAAGYEVALYNNPQPVIRLIGTGPWSLDALAEQVERSFGVAVGEPASAGPAWPGLGGPGR